MQKLAYTRLGIPDQLPILISTSTHSSLNSTSIKTNPGVCVCVCVCVCACMCVCVCKCEWAESHAVYGWTTGEQDSVATLDFMVQLIGVQLLIGHF